MIQNLKYLVAIVIVICFVSLNSCSRNINYKLQGSISESEFFEKIPFDYHKNLIIFEAVIDNEKYNFIFDTGAEIGIITPELQNKIKPKKLTSINVNDSKKRRKKLPLVNIDDIKLGEISFKDFVAAAVDLAPIENFLGCEKKIHGIIGNNLFQKAVWKIDYTNEFIYFSNNISNFQIKENSIKIPLDCRTQGNVFVKVKVNGVEKKFTFDTGSAGFIGSNKSLLNELLAKDSSLQFVQQNGIISASLHGYNYGLSNFAFIEQLAIGDITQENIIIELEDQINSSSLIGNKFWSNYTLLFDWKNCDFYLTPNRGKFIKTLEVFEYEVIPDFENLVFKLNNKWLDHPTAYVINTDNVIQSINDVDLSNLDYVKFCEAKDTLIPQLKKEDKLVLIIKEEGVQKTVTLNKQQLLPK